MLNGNCPLASVCSKAEIEAVRREGELSGLKYRAAQLRVIALDAQLAVAVAENDQIRAEMIAPELKRALFELESIRTFEILENVRIAQLISSISPRQN
jgi:hypothetical protein